MLNLFGYRATDPDEMFRAADPVGCGRGQLKPREIAGYSSNVLIWVS